MAVELTRKVKVDDTLEAGYYLDDGTDPWKTPETIVLLHGCLKPRQMFYAWIPTLARHFRVVRPHLRGHWDSTPAPQDYQWTMDGLVRDLKGFLDALGMDRVHLLGESLGGLQALYFAHRYPERLKTLTLVTSPGPDFNQHPLGKIGNHEVYHPVWGVDEKQRARVIAEFGPGNEELADWRHDEGWKCPKEGTKGYFQAAATCTADTESFLAGISVPTLYLLGAEHTRIIDAREARRLCDLMPRARLVTFPGVTAQCQFVIPEQCAAEVARFIHEQIRSGA